MKNRLPNLLLALAFSLSSGTLLAHDGDYVAPPILDSEPEDTQPVDSDTEFQVVLPAPTNEAGPEQSFQTIPIHETGTVLRMPETSAEPARPISLPQHGMKMAEVERHYGGPISREPAVGKPPITRWNYDGFSVFFEYSTVLHAVQKDRPAEIYRKDELQPASIR